MPETNHAPQRHVLHDTRCPKLGQDSGSSLQFCSCNLRAPGFPVDSRTLLLPGSSAGLRPEPSRTLYTLGLIPFAASALRRPLAKEACQPAPCLCKPYQLWIC